MVDPVGYSLEKYMDVLSARQKLIAFIIANVDTTGYKNLDLDFESEFENALREGEPRCAEVTGLRTQNDGNNVNLDRESRLLAENALRFSAASQLMRSHFRILKAAVQEGKGE